MKTWPAAILALSLLPIFPDAQAEDGFVPLFNGNDLSGWVNVNCAPETFTVRDGMIICTGFPTGVIRSERQYENFELELEWRHLHHGGNAGLFVWSYPLTAPGVPFTRSIEVQILDGRNSETYTSHGDVFAIHGAVFKPDRPHPRGAMRSLPSEWRAHPAPEWNHYRVICQDGTIQLAVNGKFVSGGTESRPRKGYICLESEGSEVHFRNIRIKELPSTNPSPEEIAPPAQDFKTLYTGVDLSGWRQDPRHEGHWQPNDWILEYDGQSEAEDKNLWTEENYGDFILICDWRLTATPEKRLFPVILPNGEEARDEQGQIKKMEAEDAGESGIYLRGSSKAQVNIWCSPAGSGEIHGYRTDRTLPGQIRAAATPKTKADHPLGRWNRFVITMKGDRVTVELNGTVVIEGAELPGLPRRGPLALKHGGAPIQFANIFLQKLD